jgi:hypothetical protein
MRFFQYTYRGRLPDQQTLRLRPPSNNSPPSSGNRSKFWQAVIYGPVEWLSRASTSPYT